MADYTKRGKQSAMSESYAEPYGSSRRAPIVTGKRLRVGRKVRPAKRGR